jgi:hypothetical protein
MDEVVIHSLCPLFIEPALWIKGVTIRAEEVGVSVDDPEVDAEEGLDGRVSQVISPCLVRLSLRPRESIGHESLVRLSARRGEDSSRWMSGSDMLL